MTGRYSGSDLVEAPRAMVSECCLTTVRRQVIRVLGTILSLEFYAQVAGFYDPNLHTEGELLVGVGQVLRRLVGLIFIFGGV